MNTTTATPSLSAPGSASSATGGGAKWFFVTSLVFLVLACLMLAGRPEFLLTPVLTGHGLSWLLLLLSGAGLSGVFGLVYWAIPKVFGIPLFSGKLVYLHYGFHLFGTLMSVGAIAWPEGLTTGAAGVTLIVCGAVTLVVNMAGTFRQPAKPDVASAYLASAALWVLIGALLGLPFAESAPYSFLVGSNWSEAWLVLAISGVLLNLPMGIALRVTPAALGIPLQKTEMAWYAFAISNAALAWMFAATAYGPMGFLLLCAAIYLMGVLLYFADFYLILQRRTGPGLAWDSKILLTAFSLVPVLACLLIFAAWERMSQPGAEEISGISPAVVEEEIAATGPLPVEFLPVDGALVLTGLLAIAIPAVIALGFQPISLHRPAAANLPRRRLAEQILLAAFFNYSTGVLLVIPGAWLGIEKMLGLGSLLLLVGAAGFLGNYFYATSKKTIGQYTENPSLPTAFPASGR